MFPFLPRLLPLAVLALATGMPAQGDASTPQKHKPDPEVAKMLDELKGVVLDRKVEHDQEGVAILGQLSKKLTDGTMIDKDQDAFAKGLDMVFRQGKVREPDKIQLYTAAAAALGLLGDKGSKPLLDAYKDKRFPARPEWVPLRGQLLKNLGKTKDEKIVKFLIDEARKAPEAALMAAAGEALGYFEESDQKVRKEIVGGLLVRYGDVDSLSRVIDPANIEAQNARDRLATISDKWNGTLSKMTRQDFRSYPEWNTWYQKHKNADWK